MTTMHRPVSAIALQQATTIYISLICSLIVFKENDHSLVRFFQIRHREESLQRHLTDTKPV